MAQLHMEVPCTTTMDQGSSPVRGKNDGGIKINREELDELTNAATN